VALLPVFTEFTVAFIVEALAAGDGLKLAIGPDPLHPAIETTNSATTKTPVSVIKERLL
jgi:hypothetical protein